MLNQRFTVVLLAVVVVATSFVAAQQQRNVGEKPLAALLEEREVTLQKIVDFTRTAYEQGGASWDSLIAAETELLDAQLDSATTAQERIVIRKSQLRMATQLEKDVAKRVEAGDVVPMDLLPVKVNRLNAQIALLREQQKN